MIQFSTAPSTNSAVVDEFAVILIGYLLEYTTVKDKAVRFRSTQIIAGIVNNLGPETELE